MRRGIVLFILALGIAPQAALAAESPKQGLAKEQASVQMPPALKEPAAEELRGTIRQYIERQEAALGAFTVPDPKQIGRLRTLSLIRVHERVGKTGDYYYSCTDMKDVATGDELDLDFDVSDIRREDTGRELKVVAVRIHKDNGKPRYTYDANDNLIPLE